MWLVRAIATLVLAGVATVALAEDKRLSSAPLKATEYHDAGLKADALKTDAAPSTTSNDSGPVAPPEEVVNKFGAQVYRALTDGDPTASGGFLRDAINSLGGICPNVTAFQRVGPKSRLLSFKVRCAKRPLYILTVDVAGRMLVDGGDGRVPTMGPTDGEVFNGLGESVNGDSKKKPRRAGAPAEDQIPVDDVKSAGPVAVSSVGAAEGQNAWFPWLASAFLVLSLVAALAMFLRFNAGSGLAPRHSSAPRRYPSELKDAMIAESPEELPDMWRHASGIYIVRGRHGKRRVFGHRWNAMLYYRWGYKVLQLR